jgi:predicted DNA-binding mobile mystery protein A
MSSAELAGRMGVGQSTISELESSEVRGTIKLDSLRRAAGALDCKLVYFLVPRTSLDDAVRAQARRKAAELTTADHRPRTESDIDELVEQLVDRPGLWSGSSEMD